MCGVFLQCYGVSNDETRNRCCELLNDRLIDECKSDEAVALAYLWFYEQLQKPNDFLELEDSVSTMNALLRTYISDWKKCVFSARVDCRLQKSLHQLVKYARDRRPIEVSVNGFTDSQDDAVSKLLIQLSRALSINQGSRTASVYTTTNNCLYTLYNLSAPSLDLVESFDQERADQVMNWLDMISSPISQTESLKEAADGLKAILKEQPEGTKLRSQFKAVFPRFYCRFCSSELVFMYLKMVNDHPNYRSSAFDLLQVIAEESGGVFMCSDVQLGLFGLLHHSLTALVESKPDSLEDVNGKKNGHAMRHRLVEITKTG